MSSESQRYFGSKWGVYLRAPDIYFELQDRFGDRMVPLEELAVIKRGITSGCDKFFFVRDITERCLAEVPVAREFRSIYGIQRVQTDKIRIVLAGDKSPHLIEAQHLEPEVHNLMETSGVFGIRIRPEDLTRQILLCSEPKSRLTKTRVLKYIEWGEREGFHNGATCASRAKARPWYDLNPGRRGDVFWPMAQQYRHLAPLNRGKLICNHNLFDIHTGLKTKPEVLCGILNSTIVAMHKHFFGRLAGTEGNLKTEVVDVKMMLVPDPRNASKVVERRIRDAVNAMSKRPTRNLPDEFELADRRALDDAVFELLGEVDPEARRELRDRLYAEMTAMYRAIRKKELLAIENKKRTKRGSTLSADQMAAEIWADLDPSLVRRFPEDFFDEAEPTEEIDLPEGRCKLVSSPLMGQAGIDIDGTHIELGDERRAELAKAVLDSGRRGAVPIPTDPDVCAQVLPRYRAYYDQVTAEFSHLVAQKTADEKMQAKVIAILKCRLA